jgi:uncharacterized membrane protein (DUF4010 family)
MRAMESEVLGALSLALGLGLLIGLQRERAGSTLGGFRTFPLIALLGAVSGLLAERWGALVPAMGLLAVVALGVLANVDKLRRAEELGGQTTEVAALLVFATGALLTTEHQTAGIVVGGLTAVLLHLKQPLHAFAGRLSEHDVEAIMRFAILSLIVLPLLPDQTYGPYEVLNPREIWWMVVLIVGIGLAGYVAYRLFGGRAGAVLSGLLGGLVSSTATTVAYARRAAQAGHGFGLAALVIVLASAVSLARVLVEVAAVAPRELATMAPPLLTLLAWMAAMAVVMVRWRDDDGERMPEQTNPAELKGALLFGALYALVLLATAAVKDHFGARALYGVAVVSGFVDLDAITLSTARLAAADRLEPATAWRVILTAALSNMAFKTGIAWVLGSTRLMARLWLPVAAVLAGGVALLLLWPRG